MPLIGLGKTPFSTSQAKFSTMQGSVLQACYHSFPCLSALCDFICSFCKCIYCSVFILPLLPLLPTWNYSRVSDILSQFSNWFQLSAYYMLKTSIFQRKILLYHVSDENLWWTRYKQEKLSYILTGTNSGLCVYVSSSELHMLHYWYRRQTMWFISYFL